MSLQQKLPIVLSLYETGSIHITHSSRKSIVHQRPSSQNVVLSSKYYFLEFRQTKVDIHESLFGYTYKQHDAVGGSKILQGSFWDQAIGAPSTKQYPNAAHWCRNIFNVLGIIPVRAVRWNDVCSINYLERCRLENLNLVNFL